MAEDKRFAQFAVPESAFASRCSLGFFDRCTSSSFAELDRRIRLVRLYSYRNSSSPQKAGFSGTPYTLAVSSAGRARSKRSRRGTRHSARIYMRSKSNSPYANAYGLLLAEDKRFEIRLRRFTLFHQASKSQVLSHFFTFAFHQLSQHFTKTKDT